MRTIICLLFLAPAAYAAPVTWTLNGVTFDDGTTATGSFSFDSEAVFAGESEPGIFSDVSIVTTWNTIEDPQCSQGVSNRLDCGGSPNILLWFDSSLALGGTVQIAFGGESSGAMYREIVSGSVTAVPVPAAAWLFVSALGLLGCRKATLRAA